MGSKYGNFDVDQLVRNIKMIMGNKGKREIVVDKKGLNALENYMLSRYFSRSLLIYNKNIAGFEILLQTAFELLLEKYDKEDANYPYGYQNILKTSTTEDFTTFNDHYILNRIFEEARKSGNTNLKRISKMILYRTPLKGVYKIHNLNKPDTKCVNGLKIEKIKSIHKTSKYSDKFINILWINKKEWAFFKHGEVPMIKNPETAIDIMVDDEEIYKRTLRLHDTSNDEEKFSYLYKDDQSIMAHLCGLKNEVCGIYTTEKHAKSVEREIKKLLSDIS
jgi:HD superfamily phosphohydrolase